MNYSTYFSTNTTDYIAKDLIGRMLTFDNGQEKLGGYIVEAEAYMGKKDRAAHSYGGRRSPANEGLYGKGGTIYIYAQRQYFFFDVATRVQNEPQGVLIRAIDPTLGIETMIKNRHGKDGVLLTNGPAKMMQAFGIHDKNWNLHFSVKHLVPMASKSCMNLKAKRRIRIKPRQRRRRLSTMESSTRSGFQQLNYMCILRRHKKNDYGFNYRSLFLIS